MAFPHGADVVVRYGAVEGDAVAVVPLHEFQAPSIGAARPPVQKLGVGHRVHRQLVAAIGICAQVKHKRIQVVLLSTKRQGGAKDLQPRVLAVENEDTTIPRRCLHREEVVPNRGYN